MRFREWSQALDALAQAQDFCGQTDERYWEPERHRLSGELLLSRGSPREQAETCFLQALEQARARGAVSLQLRAATSLAQLWRAMKKEQAAKECLGPVLESITDTDETSDLREAKRTFAMLG
jgi:predicted ATPase